MSTRAQIAANRRNSQNSTGPRTAAGKASSSLNALKSGIDAQTNIIRGENAADLQSLADTYYAECQPATAQELSYVDILIRNDWQLRRLERVDAQLWEYQLDGLYKPKPESDLGRARNSSSPAFARLQRRKNDILRSTILARQELKKLQSEPLPEYSEPIESETTSSVCETKPISSEFVCAQPASSPAEAGVPPEDRLPIGPQVTNLPHGAVRIG